MTLELFCTGSLSELGDVQLGRLTQRELAPDSEAVESAAAIIERVRRHGDSALIELAAEFDHATLDRLEVPRADWETAANQLDGEVRTALERAARNINQFHEALLPPAVRSETEPGVVLERRFAPVPRAGVYAPGGRASYPSSVLMGVVPARAAGVGEVIVCSPPGEDGQVAAAVQAACWIAGADRLFALGGAGAIAAMALGTQSVPRVDVVVGPGNAYVNEAKRQLAGTVRIDSPAGPSELLVLADDSVSAEWVAAEVVAQAEHDTQACAGVVCIGSRTAEEVVNGLHLALERAPRSAVVREALAKHGFVLEARDMDEAIAFANRYAPEHLAIMTRDATGVAERLRSSGTVFVGPNSSVSFGDYTSGANHVLPTAGAARAFSGLSSEHFLRSYTIQTISAEGARRLAQPTQVLALAEGLPGHAEAARLRGAHTGDGP